MIHRKIIPAFTDDRGTIADIFYSEEINHVGVIASLKGAVRGNHFHKQTTQHTYLVSGAMSYYWKNDNGESGVCNMGPGDLVTSGPNEVHAMHFTEDSVIMVFSQGLRGGKDYEADTFRVPLIKSVNGAIALDVEQS
jgi:quercetin dioxygenase-like cupin family protein